VLSAAAAAAVVVVVVVAVAARTVDTAYPARCLMRTGIVVVASARWVVRAMSQVSAVAVVAAAAVQANAWSLALKWLSILSTSVWARSHATHWLPALQQVVALQTVDNTINSCPIAQHMRMTYRCGYLLWLFTHTCTP
jgi:hypothetical protein